MMTERHKGRPTRGMLADARARLAKGESVDAVANAVGMRPRAVKRLAAKQAPAPSAPIEAPPLPLAAPGGEAPEAVIEELFGPPPVSSTVPPSGGAPAEDDDPLARPLTQGEIVGMGEMLVGTVDSMLAAAFGGPAPQGLSEGQRGFLKVFSKRISNAFDQLTDASKMTPESTLLLTAVVLIVPRGVQRVGGFLQRRRDAKRAVSGRAKDGENVRGDPMGAGAGTPSPLPVAGA
jgi:hypothetical protein